MFPDCPASALTGRVGTRTLTVAFHSVSLFVGSSSAGEKPVALTVKVDGETYVRLSTLRVTQRRTNQDILDQALKEYLTRAGA